LNGEPYALKGARTVRGGEAHLRFLLHSRFAAVGCTFTAPSTASVTRSNSSSANSVIFRRPKRFLRKALTHHGRPNRIVIDGTQTNREAIISCDAESRLRERSHKPPIHIRKSQYLNNRIEQDHRRIKRRVRSMLGFKSMANAQITLSSIELVHMMRKRQARFAYNPSPSIAEQFETLTA
jgi:hypothetical protein